MVLSATSSQCSESTDKKIDEKSMKKIRILDTVVIVCDVPALWAALQYLRGTFEGAERVVAYLVAIVATGLVVKGIYFLIQGKAREKSEES